MTKYARLARLPRTCSGTAGASAQRAKSNPRADTIRAIYAELRRARDRYPGNIRTMDVLKHFVIELERSLRQHNEDRVHDVDVFSQAIIVAVMAIRVAEEGDAKYKYRSYQSTPGPLFDILARAVDAGLDPDHENITK